MHPRTSTRDTSRRRFGQLGVIVDTAHRGRLTTLEACKVSQAPVVATHTAAQSLFHHDRGKSDEEIEAIAATDGIVGVVTVPFFLGPGTSAATHCGCSRRSADEHGGH
ncbi:MAG TPA: membrane dipeptidase [Nitriliruptorales bacterium]